MGEAPARSSLVPRDLTAEVVFDALASLGLLSCAYALRRVCVCSFIFILLVYAPRFARNFVVGNTPCGVLYWSLLGGILCFVFCCCV